MTRVMFYCADKPREIMIARAFGQGVLGSGDRFEIRRNGDYGSGLKHEGPGFDTDLACFFGVKGRSKQLLRDHRMLGLGTLFFDKGYTRNIGEGRHTEYTRISVNAPTPLEYFMREKRSSERWKKLGLRLEARKTNPSGHILLCTSSQKYNVFHGIGDATEHAAGIVQRLRKVTERQIIYRPKPSWIEAVPIKGSSFSHGGSTIYDALRGCHCLVTHGATAAMDAVVTGVPAIALGPSIAKPVCGDDLGQIENPFWADDEKRFRWACAMAHTQFTLTEMRSGYAWSVLKAEFARQCGNDTPSSSITDLSLPESNNPSSEPSSTEPAATETKSKGKKDSPE